MQGPTGRSWRVSVSFLKQMNLTLISIPWDSIPGEFKATGLSNCISLHVLWSSSIPRTTLWWQKVTPAPWDARAGPFSYFTRFSKILLGPWFLHHGIYGVKSTTSFNVKIESDSEWITLSSVPSPEWVLIKWLNQTHPGCFIWCLRAIWHLLILFNNHVTTPSWEAENISL